MNTAKDNTGVVIRPMTIDDLPIAFHLGEQLFNRREYVTLYRTWNQYEVIDTFSGNEESCFVAEVDGEFAGFLLSTIYDKRKTSLTVGYLIWLGVDDRFSRRGVATALFERFKTYMIDEGADLLVADTEASNTGAIRFFEKHGFNSQYDHVYLSRRIERNQAEDKS